MILLLLLLFLERPQAKAYEDYIELSWPPYQSTAGVATSLNLKRQHNNQPPYVLIATLPLTQTVYDDYTTTKHQSYCYVLTAVGPNGESAPSDAFCTKMP